MKRLVVLAGVALALAGGVASSSAAPQYGKFVVVFAPPKTQDEKTLVSLLKAAQLPRVFGELSKHLKLTRNITLSVRGGDAGPYYDPRTRTIVLNHPFSAFAFTYFVRNYPKITGYQLGQRFAALEYFILFHEVGHALIDQWDLPVLGREEDAVDAFSTIFMTEQVKRGDFALEGAIFFDYLAGSRGGPKGQLTAENFADEHSLDRQRAYSIACWVYGSDTKKYGYVGQAIPASRRVRCPDEYRQLKKSWGSLLKPHLR